jgi:hypothetical protein
VVAAVAALGIDHAASPRAVVEARTRAVMLHVPEAGVSARAEAGRPQTV